MPRGTPDGKIIDAQFAAQINDPGSLSSLLWGFSPIDGQGRPVYLDTFNNGLTTGWRLANTGGGSSVPSLVSGNGLSFVPPNAAQLNPGITANDRSYFFREMFQGKTTRIGFEAAIRMSAAMPEVRLQLDYKAVDNPGGFPILRWVPSAGTWQIWTNGGWVAIYTPGAIVAPTQFFVQVKFVVDVTNYQLNTGRWIRVYIGDKMIDVSGYLLDISATTYTGLLIATVIGVSVGAGSTNAQIGYILITKDEP